MNRVERAGFHAYSFNGRFLYQERKALEFAEEHASKNPIIMFSGGKDSAATAHIFNRVGRFPIVHIDTGGQHPLTLNFTRQLAAQFGWEFDVQTPAIDHVQLLSLCWDFGHNGAHAPDDLVKELLLENPGVAALERHGTTAYALGLRSEESGNRNLTVAVHGDNYTKANGTTRLLPIKGWSIEDVFAYHVKHGIPLHPAYTVERFPNERITDIRVGSVLNFEMPWGGPCMAKLQRFQPEFYGWLKRKLPNVPWPS